MFITREKKEIQKVSEVIACVCDCCKKRIESDDLYEFHEMHHIHIKSGYGSIFGDGKTVQCDLCQHCLKELIGEFARNED